MSIYKLWQDSVLIASAAVPWKYIPGEGGFWQAGQARAHPVGLVTQTQIRTTMTPIRFEEQFAIDEQLEIEDRRAYVAGTLPDSAADEMATYQKRVLDLLFGKLKDQRLTEVDVADPSVIAGVGFCHMIGVLTDARAAEILRGIEEPVA